MRWPRIIGMTALLVSVTAPLFAQDHDCQCGLREVKESETNPNRRQGLWAALGGGAGVESFNAYNGLGWSNGLWGGLVFARLGLALNQNLTIGAEGDLWIRDYPGYRRTMGSLMIIGQIYPVSKGGFFLKGGGGWTRDDLHLYSFHPSIPPHRTGWGYVAGLGYDARVAQNVSITPSIDFTEQYYGGVDERMINLGLAITLH